MRLDELLDVYRRRREDAKRIQSRASVTALYEQVIAELEQLKTIGPEKMLRTAEVAELLGVSQATIAKQCARGDFPGAEKTSGASGDWRIPASALSRAQEPKRRRAGRILEDDDL